ncbi:MAG: AbrB/MazE/SpoVT family DNA-binding domain-containing protein [archaeon]
MKCHKCNIKMEYKNGLEFNQGMLDGWKCKKCGEIYYDSDQAQRILLMNKLKNQGFEISLNRVKSNLILRIPKAVSEAIGLDEKKKVNLTLVSKNEIRIRA